MSKVIHLVNGAEPGFGSRYMLLNPCLSNKSHCTSSPKACNSDRKVTYTLHVNLHIIIISKRVQEFTKIFSSSVH